MTFNPEMRALEARLGSIKRHDKKHVFPADMRSKCANAGLYMERPAFFRCFQCGVIVDDLKRGDDPLKKHIDKVDHLTSCAWASVKCIEKVRKGDFDEVLDRPFITRIQVLAKNTDRVVATCLATFDYWPLTDDYPSPESIAATGMYWDPCASIEDDTCACPFCSRQVAQWEPGDIPFNDHARKEGLNCEFLWGQTSQTSHEGTTGVSADERIGEKSSPEDLGTGDEFMPQDGTDHELMSEGPTTDDNLAREGSRTGEKSMADGAKIEQITETEEVKPVKIPSSTTGNKSADLLTPLTSAKSSSASTASSKRLKIQQRLESEAAERDSLLAKSRESTTDTSLSKFGPKSGSKRTQSSGEHADSKTPTVDLDREKQDVKSVQDDTSELPPLPEDVDDGPDFGDIAAISPGEAGQESQDLLEPAGVDREDVLLYLSLVRDAVIREKQDTAREMLVDRMEGLLEMLDQLHRDIKEAENKALCT